MATVGVKTLNHRTNVCSLYTVFSEVQ